MSNYPEGAANDPNAPYNDRGISGMCVYCDIDELREIARDNASEMAHDYNKSKAFDEDEAVDDDYYEECLEKVLSEANYCRQCYFEDYEE